MIPVGSGSPGPANPRIGNSAVVAPKEDFHRDVWLSSDGVRWEKEPYWSQRGTIGGAAVFENRIWVLGGGTYDTPNVKTRNVFND